MHLNVPKLTQELQEITTGLLLGDGELLKVRGPNDNSCLRVTQRAKKKAFLDRLAILFSDYFAAIDKVWRKYKLIRLPNGTMAQRALSAPVLGAYSFRTRQSPIWTALEKKWYLRDNSGRYVYKVLKSGWKQRIKTVPRGVRLTAHTIAWWYMGDGSNHPKQRYAEFSTGGFTAEDCEVLIEALKEVGIQSYKNLDSRNHWRIQTQTKSYLTFLDLVKPHMLPCFSYKIDTSKYTAPIDVRGENHPNANFTNAQVRQILRMNKTKSQRQIGKFFGVYHTYIGWILRGKTWKHIERASDEFVRHKNGVKVTR